MSRLLIFTILIIPFSCSPKKISKSTYDKSKTYSKIVADNIFSSEILYHLGKKAHRKVIGIPKIADDARYSVYTNVWPKDVKRISRAGEEVMALKPDLVITATFHSIDYRHLLQRFNIDYLFLRPFEGFNAYRKNVSLIAEATNSQSEGQKLLNRFESRLAKIKKRGEALLRHKKITAVSYVYGYVKGIRSTFHDAVEAAGLIHLPATKGVVKFRKVSLEQIIAWKPNLFAISCGQIGCEKAKKRFLEKPVVSKLKATTVAIPSNVLASSNERMLELSERLQNAALQAVK